MRVDRRKARQPSSALPVKLLLIDGHYYVYRSFFAIRELSKLPDIYRIAIILCDLEGCTRKEAARRLKIPEGTVAGRLTRGRALLADRLTRRGLTGPSIPPSDLQTLELGAEAGEAMAAR